MNVGDYIKKLRVEAGYTQEELGKLLDVKRAAVQKWECGKVKNLKRETIKKMASIFNVSPSSFIIDDNQSTQIELTHHEEKVITAYRDKPAMQPAVDTLLGVEAENGPIDDDDYFSGELFALPSQETPKSHLKVADDFSPLDLWYDQNS